jgi:hypothetical protein
MYCTRWTQENEQKPRQDTGCQDTMTARSPNIQASRTYGCQDEMIAGYTWRKDIQTDRTDAVKIN